MAHHDATMTVDCRTCPVREVHCGECMVPVLLELEAPEVRGHPGLDADERRAVALLVRAGLVDAETASRARAVLEPARSTSGGVAPGRAVG
ncbi:MAG: hypothetical protein ACRCY8_13525 [Dermatophilaceae bacterium]